MTDLRKAAEALINHWEAGEFKNCTGYMAGHVGTLRQALAHEALDRMVAENQRLGLYDDNYCTPEVGPEVSCKTHPDAPHGFDRNASHSADRYVCECEGWEPERDIYGEIVEGFAALNSYTKNDTTAGVLHKEWVGLTNEEIADVWKTEYFNLFYELPRAIEAKLKEKNCAASRKWEYLSPVEFNSIKDNATTIGYAITKTEAILREKNT